MSLLRDIQKAVIEERSDLSPILLKVRLLAARLGSQPLEEWVKHESEGYPIDSTVPEYRIIPVSYNATFSGPCGSGIRNAPIATYLIKKFAGEDWVRYKIRQSIAAIDDLLARAAEGNGQLNINASNLILLLQGKVYKDYDCNDVTGTISRAEVAALRHSVRSRVLDLTIELEKSIPDITKITLDNNDARLPQNPAIANQISQQIIYGNVTSITSTGETAQFNISIGERDTNALIKYLISAGIPKTDAKAFAKIVANEEPESKQEPYGSKAKDWLIENLKKAASGTWKIGVSVATEVIKEATLKYYGLK